jgi:hypothetical protein
MHLTFPMERTYTSPSQRPSKHRNAKRTKGRRRAEQARAGQLAQAKRVRNQHNGPYRD